jgi:GT2 family glycosyltransferase
MNRPKELRECLDRVLRQTPKPASILIVDDGCLDIAPIDFRLRQEGVPLVYIRKESPGLIGSLNLIADRADTPWVLILDDDILLEDHFVARISRLLQSPKSDAIVGIAGYPIQRHYLRRSWRTCIRQKLERFFLIGGGTEGRALSSSYVTDYQLGSHPAHPWSVDHVPGGLGWWRSDVLRAVRFDECYTGYAYGNDKDFALRAKTLGRLVCIPTARAEHRKSPNARVPSRSLGRMKILNQHRFFRRHREQAGFHALAYAWATLGLMLVTAIACLTAPASLRAQELRGMLEGIGEILFRKGTA